MSGSATRDFFPQNRRCKAYFKDQLSIGGNSHKFVSPPPFQRRVELVVRPVGSPTEFPKRLIARIGYKYLPGGEDLCGQRGREQFLLLFCSQPPRPYPSNSNTPTHQPQLPHFYHT